VINHILLGSLEENCPMFGTSFFKWAQQRGCRGRLTHHGGIRPSFLNAVHSNIPQAMDNVQYEMTRYAFFSYPSDLFGLPSAYPPICLSAFIRNFQYTFPRVSLASIPSFCYSVSISSFTCPRVYIFLPLLSILATPFYFFVSLSFPLFTDYSVFLPAPSASLHFCVSRCCAFHFFLSLLV
jgi:hypothetical protein